MPLAHIDKVYVWELSLNAEVLAAYRPNNMIALGLPFADEGDCKKYVAEAEKLIDDAVHGVWSITSFSDTKCLKLKCHKTESRFKIINHINPITYSPAIPMYFI